jgi:hypothetical protein
VRTFGQDLFAYIATLVPHWRVGDEAWPIGGNDNHITGIGVERNYGGQVLVIAWDENVRRQLARFHKDLEPLFKRIVVVVDDRKSADLDAIERTCTPITVLPWSRRVELAGTVIQDTAD